MMRSWLRAMVPLVVVAGVNLLAAYVDNDRVAWLQLVDGCGAFGTAVFIATGVGAALLALAVRRPGAWALAVPALPWIVADRGRLDDARRSIDDLLTRAPPIHESPYLSRELLGTMGDMGLLRILAAQQSLALVLALVATQAGGLRLRAITWPGRALVAVVLGVGVAALQGPWRALDASALDISWTARVMLALSLLLPSLLVAAFAADAVREAPMDGTPYRVAAPQERATTPYGDGTLAVVGALLMPWFARGYSRGAVAIEGAWRSFSGRGLLEDEALHREALLSFASRWDRYVLPASAVLVAVALARGVGRPAVRVWAATLALLSVGEMDCVRVLLRIRAETCAQRSAVERVWAPGTVWALRTIPNASRRVLRWARNGAETSREDEGDAWPLGPRVEVDPDMRGDVWRAHLRRWRAHTGGGLLTLVGTVTMGPLRWYSDPRQEVPLQEGPTLLAQHAAFEVADATQATGTLEVRVVDERAIDIVDYAIGTTTRVALDAWAPGLLAREAVVVPARDEVTAGMVVRAAVRVRDGRVPVRLGW